MGAKGTFHPFRRLLRDGQEAFGGLIVLIPTVSIVACGVAGSRTSALTLPLPEEVSSRLTPREERRQLPAAMRGCAWVSVQRQPTQACSSPRQACRRLVTAPGTQRAQAGRSRTPAPRAAEADAPGEGGLTQRKRPLGSRVRGRRAAAVSRVPGYGVSKEGREDRKAGPAGLLKAAQPPRGSPTHLGLPGVRLETDCSMSSSSRPA